MLKRFVEPRERRGVHLGVDTGDLIGQAKALDLIRAELSETSRHYFEDGKEFPQLAQRILSVFRDGTRDGALEGQLMGSLQMEMAGTVLGLDTKAKKDSLLVEIKRVVDGYERFLGTRNNQDSPAN